MRKFLLTMIAFTLVLSLAACGGGKTGAQPKNNGEVTSAGSSPANKEAPDDKTEGNSKSAKDKKSSSPTFSGDVIQFLGLVSDEAFDLLGNGALSEQTGYISNDKNNMEVYLTNSDDDIYKYVVYLVRLNAKTNVTFDGIEVGDTLKDADKHLMDGGAIYSGDLKWILDIDGTSYLIWCATSDDKTISSLEAMISDISIDEINKQNKKLEGPYSYIQDMYELEPRYWE